MPRKRPEINRSKIAKMLIEEYQPQSAQDIQEALKDLLGDTMEQMLKVELYEHLGYEYGETPLSLNTRNGSSKKTVRSSYGNIDLNIPRYREGTFEPQSLRKYGKDISNIENQIISMYGEGIPLPSNIINSFHSLDIIGWGRLWQQETYQVTSKIFMVWNIRNNGK